MNPAATQKYIDDKKSWKKNWFDAEVELPSATMAQRHGMISAYIKKIDSYKVEDITKLLYTLRVRTMILLFFGIEPIQSSERDTFRRLREFLHRDLSVHKGWFDRRSKDEDSVIGEFQYAYALCASENLEKGARAFTLADKHFGAVRHEKYILSLDRSLR